MSKMEQITREMEAMFKELVPAVGKAETEAGEILRAFARIRYRYYNDGDMIGIEYGNETCNAAARYLATHVHPAAVIISLNWGCDDFDYPEFLDNLEKRIYYWLGGHPEARTNETEDFWTHSRPEDTNWDEDEDEDEDDGWIW